MDDLTSGSARAIVEAIRTKDVSVVEAVDAHLARIAQVNPRLNAVVQLADEEARREAREADAALAHGEPLGPLHGLPFTVKDWIETAGLVCAAGYENRRDVVPKRDATVVARMRRAGAILLGKTNVQHENPVYGRTYNPYDRARTTGGSSSGEAAIVAAGGSPLGLASDSGGSIRVPAAYCGVAGLKPTNGLVPNTGHFPRIASLSDPRTTIGLLARSVDDLALALPVIAGPDAFDPGVAPVPVHEPGAVDLATLRVAWYAEFDGVTPSPDVVSTLHAAVDAVREAVDTVEEAVPERIEESLAITRQYWKRMRSYSWREWRAGESVLSADEVERSLFDWDRLRRSFLAFMTRHDAIVCPATETPAPEDVSERDFLYTLPYSLTGYPCVVVRAGTSSAGLPVAVQVIARPWRDDVALALARRIESALGGWQPAVE